MAQTLSKQTELLIRHLKTVHVNDIDEAYTEKVLGWVRDLPPEGRPEELIKLVQTKFKLTPADLNGKLDKDEKKYFDDLVPQTGWLRDYYHWTLKTEPPT